MNAPMRGCDGKEPSTGSGKLAAETSAERLVERDARNLCNREP